MSNDDDRRDDATPPNLTPDLDDAVRSIQSTGEGADLDDDAPEPAAGSDRDGSGDEAPEAQRL